MRKTEMLWFEDVSALNEPVLSFPVLGRISMRQFLILGTASMASYALFSGTHGPASAVPACVGALLTFVKPRVGSPEWLASSMVAFLAGKIAGRGALVQPGRKRQHRLAPPRPLAAAPRASRIADAARSLAACLRGRGACGHVRIRVRGPGRRRISVYLGGQKEPAFSELIEVQDIKEDAS